MSEQDERAALANVLHERIDGDYLIGCPDGDIPIQGAGAKDVVWWAVDAVLASDWLAEHDRQVAVETLRDAADDWDDTDIVPTPDLEEPGDWLRDRADRIGSAS